MDETLQPGDRVRFVRGGTASGQHPQSASEPRSFWIPAGVRGKAVQDEGGPEVLISVKITGLESYYWRVPRDMVQLYV
jgi:hypothetical protein